MHAFIGGLQRGGLLLHKLTCLINENNLTLDDMIDIASTHTSADDDAGGELTAIAIPNIGIPNGPAEDGTWGLLNAHESTNMKLGSPIS